MIFFISVVDACKTLQIDAPEAIDSVPFEFPLFQETFKRFSYASFNPPNAD